MATSIGGVPVNPGDTLTVPDSDYLFGSGEISVIIRQVLGVITHHDEPWVEMTVDQYAYRGQFIPRTLTVRLGAIRDAARAKAAQR